MHFDVKFMCKHCVKGVCDDRATPLYIGTYQINFLSFLRVLLI
jgi:hypothetical protein